MFSAFDLSTRPSSRISERDDSEEATAASGSIDETKVQRWGVPDTTFSFSSIDNQHQQNNKRRKMVDESDVYPLSDIVVSPSPSMLPIYFHDDYSMVDTSGSSVEEPEHSMNNSTNNYENIFSNPSSTSLLLQDSSKEHNLVADSTNTYSVVVPTTAVPTGAIAAMPATGAIAATGAMPATGAMTATGAVVIPNLNNKRKPPGIGGKQQTRKTQQKRITIPIGAGSGSTVETIPTHKSLENKMVEVLNYTSSLFRALNNGSFVELQSIIDTILTPECMLRTNVTQISKDSIFVNRIVPRNKIFEY